MNRFSDYYTSQREIELFEEHELEQVKRPNHLWTVISGEQYDEVHAGMMKRHALFYIVSTEPWKNENERYYYE